MSAQRRSTRKRAANTRITDLQESSPIARSQSANKRRKVNSNSQNRPSRRRQTSDDDDGHQHGYGNRDFNNDTEEDVDEDQDEEEDEEPTLEDVNQDLTDLATRYLDVSEDPVAAAEAYKPEMWDERNVQAFAKISGRTWTYFVREVKIVIGRLSEDVKESDPEKVHIDLGPNKMISRLHAELYFDSQSESWNISVHGRNGVRVNERQVRRNESHRVESGDILGIAGTQMLFQLAGVQMHIKEFFAAKMRLGQAEDEMLKAASGQQTIHSADSDDPFRQALQTTTNETYAQPALPQHTTITRPKTPEPIEQYQQPLPTSSVKKRSPSNKKGMMIESTEQIDYSLESSKDIKPGCSYAAMITWAILSTQDEAISLNGIYQWIKDHYAFYRLSQSGWQNSIRHNLSLNQNFRKVPRRADEPGKGMKWAFVPENREATIAAANKNASKGGGRTSSAPGSPAGGPVKGGFVFPSANGEYKTSPGQRTPPLSSYPPNPADTYTPSRYQTGTNPAYGPSNGRLPVLSDETSPLPRRNNGHLTIQGSSPTLTSGAYNSTDMPMHTPAPRAYNLHVPQPNTLKLPTSHMTDSSPAPFWKPLGLAIGSTPARWPDSSPQKIGTINAGPPAPMSSSPPPMPNGAESPTRRPPSHSQRMSASFSAPQASESLSAIMHTNNKPQLPPLPNPASMSGPGVLEDAGIDLMKGFTKISTFHQAPQRTRLPPAQM